MTTRLEQAFTEASKLPPKEQDALVNWLLAELRSQKNGIDYLLILKRNYPNWLLKHLLNIIEITIRDSETLDIRKQKCYTSSKQKHFSSQGNGKHASQHHKGRENGIP